MKTIGVTASCQNEIGKEGYEFEMKTWTENRANLIDKEELPEVLTEGHWKVIECIRRYYLEMGIVPPVRMLTRRTGLSLRDMQKLFPSGLSKGACKIAGIPAEAIRPSFLYP